jgi:hypothetical protein
MRVLPQYIPADPALKLRRHQEDLEQPAHLWFYRQYRRSFLTRHGVGSDIDRLCVRGLYLTILDEYLFPNSQRAMRRASTASLR